METLFMPALFSFQDKQGAIDKAAMRNYIRYLIKRGVKGFYANGTTGEAFLLSTAARMQLLEIVREEVPADSFLMAQIGCISTQESLKLAQHAQSVGVDAVSAITPFYYKFSWAEITAHYSEIINGINLPFCPYHFPLFSGVNPSKEEWTTLLKNPQVQYLKYTAADLYTLQRLSEMCPEITVFMGCDEVLLSGLVAGAKGGIGATYSFIFPLIVTLSHSLKEGDIESAKMYQSRINKFVDLLLNLGIVQLGKYLLDKLGVVSSAPIHPFLPITDANKKIADAFCEKYPELFI